MNLVNTPGSGKADFSRSRENRICGWTFVGVNKGYRFGTCHLSRIRLAPIICARGAGSACSRRHPDGRAAIQWYFSEIQHGKEAADWVLMEVPGSFAFVRFTSRSKARFLAT